MYTIQLKDKTQIKISSIRNMSYKSFQGDKIINTLSLRIERPLEFSSINEYWSKFTQDNISSISIYDEENSLIASYSEFNNVKQVTETFEIVHALEIMLDKGENN